MANVQFLQGSQEGYDALENKISTTFYFTGTNLYLGNIKLSNASDIEAALGSLADNTDITNIRDMIGNLENLSTVEKSNLIGAINEVLSKVKEVETASKVTIETDIDNNEFSKVYIIKQGDTEIGTIDIPKNMIIESGSVETDPDEDHQGTFIVLTLANENGDRLYIDAASLVDIYTTQEEAPQVQLEIDSNNEISASIVEGSITDTEIAENAITTEKIADGNITLIKLSDEIKESLEKAQNAIQKIETGTTNGTIKVDGIEVAVAGLGNAAFKSADEFEAAGAATDALNDAKAYVNGLLSWNSF